jgi:small redox-active disulfide protein 2
MLTIKILGPGCANCRKLEQVARQAVDSLNIESEIIKVTDVKDIMAYDVLQTPGLVINEKLVLAGRIPTVGSIVEWIRAAEPRARSAPD